MKALIKVTDRASRINPTTGETLEAFRPCVVTVTEFVNTLVLRGAVKVIKSELPDTVKDSEFKKFYADCKKDEALAIESFLKAADVNPDGKLSDDKAAEAAAAKAAADAAAKAAADAAAKQSGAK